MLKGLRTAETAMNIQMNRTNVLANNLANANTAGFKQMLTQVTEAAGGPEDQDLGAGAADRRPVPGNVGGNVRDLILDVRAPIDMTQGGLRETGNPLDVALRGDGLFKVRHAGGDAYTRAGSFSLNDQRQLVTSAGDLVLGDGGPIALPDGEVLVRADGAILVDGAEAGRLSIVDFEDPSRLRHVGDTLFTAPADMAAQPVPADRVAVEQGMLELSNVNPIDTLVGMIAAQRAFEMEAKVMQASDRTLDKAVNQLSRKA